MSTVNHKFKNHIFAFVPNGRGVIKDHGISLIVLDDADGEILGIRLLLNGNENFSCPLADFTVLVEQGILVDIEKLPKFVLTSFKKQYKINLQAP